MAGERTIRIKVDGDSKALVQMGNDGERAMSQLDRNARKAAGGLDTHSKSAGGAADANDRARKSFSGVGLAAGAAAVGLGVAAAAWVSATAAALVEVERLGAQTDTVLKSMRVAWTDTDHITNYADKIEKLSGIEAEQVQTGQNLLLTYGNITNQVGRGNDVFDQATMLMTDMSVATGKAMPEAANLLGKALNDPIRGVSALTKVGVQFTEQQKAQIKALVESGDVMGAQKVILAELTKQFGGSAKAFGETTAGQVLKLQNRFGELSEELLADVLPAINALLDAAAGVIEWIKENEGLIKTLVVALAGLATTWLLVHGAIKLVNGVTAAWNAVSGLAQGSTAGLGASFAGLSTAAKIASLSMGAIGIVASVIGVALAAFGGQSQKAQERQQKLADAGKSVAQAIMEQNGAIDANARKTASKAAEDSGLLKQAQALGFSLPQVTDALLGQGDAYDKLQGAIQRRIDANFAEQDALGGPASQQNQERIKQLALEAGALQQLQGDLKEATNQRDGEFAAAKRQSEASQESTGATEDSTVAIQNNIEALQQQIDMLREAAGGVLSQRDAERGLAEASAQAAEAIKKNGATLDINTEAGRDNQAALDNIADSTLDLVDAMVKNNATSDQLSGAMQRGRDSFIATARQMGLNEQQAAELANQLGLIPTQVNTRVTLDDSFARRRAQEFADLIRNIPPEKLVNLRVSTQGGGHILAGQATGGPEFGGRDVLVGERGPEILRFPSGWVGGRIFSNHQSQQIGSNGDMTVFVSIDGQQLQGRIDRTVRENNRSMKRGASSGAGGAR